MFFRAITLGMFLSAALLAQTASITGRITDPGGAVVPNATVTAQSTTTGVTSTATSNGEGYYSIPALNPGSYDVTVSKTGFSPVKQTGLVLEVQQVARFDVTLQVGAITNTVEVNASAVMLDSETATLGQVVESKQIT
jgi:hypothetical protein